MVHQYLRPDGTIGSSGKPDPKRILVGNKLLAVRVRTGKDKHSRMPYINPVLPFCRLMVSQLHYGDAIVSFAIITKAIGFNQRMLG